MDDGKIRCSTCGQEAEGSFAYCPHCGARTTGDTPSPRQLADPYLLLMTANVLRLRRQWSLAEAKCSELLKLDPESAAAHSLMGDILRDQGRKQDAIEWYKMAIDRDPANVADRKKLEILIDQQFNAPAESCVLRLAKSLWERWRRPVMEEPALPRPRAVCPWAMVTAGVFAVTLLGAFGFILIGRRSSPTVLPTTPDGATRRYGAVHIKSGGTLLSNPASNTQEMTGDITALEWVVYDQVRAKALQVDANCQVHHVEVDPIQAQVQVEISMPAYWDPAVTRKGIARVANAVAPVAADIDARFHLVKIRGLTRHSSGPDLLALVAEGTADEVRQLTQAIPAEEVEKTFTSVWWSETLRPENIAGTEGPAAPQDVPAGGH